MGRTQELFQVQHDGVCSSYTRLQTFNTQAHDFNEKAEERQHKPRTPGSRNENRKRDLPNTKQKC
jgi:hypothetical protein